MIYTGLSRIGEIVDVKAHGDGDISEVYGGIGETNPIYYKSRTITGTFPLSYKALGKPLSDYLISGNTVQNGTPTPEAPVDVVGCGERTENLFDKNTAVYGEYLNENGTVYPETTQKTAWLSDYIPVTAGLTYTLSLTGSRRGKFFKADKTPYQTSTMDFSGLRNTNTFTIPETVAYIRFTIYKGVATPDVVMLNAGSTALPYEPFGYKLPIICGGETNNIYLGEVEATRRIKKYEFTGQEDITFYSTNATRVGFYFTRVDAILNGRTVGICSHFKPQPTPFSSTIDGVTFGANDKNYYFTFSAYSVSAYNLTDIASIKAWLVTKYTAGTPVTVWYVLAEPETGIVNKPLHKIGDYADTINFVQAGVTIPTVSGANILTIPTTILPSSISINGNIKSES